MIPKWNLYKEARRPQFDRRCGLSKMQVSKTLSLEYILRNYDTLVTQFREKVLRNETL